MTTGRRWWIRGVGGVIGLAALGTGIVAALKQGRLEPSRDDASVLLNLTLPDPAGQAVALSKWRGRPLLVNFWATWCGPCVQEMPDLQVLARESHGDFDVIGIAIDNAGKVVEFAARLGIDYPLLVTDASGLDLLRALGHPEASLPFTVLVDSRGVIRHRIRGRIDPVQTSQWLRALKARLDS